MPAHYRHLRPYRQFSFATDNFVVVVRSAEAVTSAEVNQRNDHAIRCATLIQLHLQGSFDPPTSSPVLTPRNGR